MAFLRFKSISTVLCGIALVGATGCATMAGHDPNDRIEPTRTSMSEPLRCLGQQIDRRPSKYLVLFVPPIGNGTITPASQATDLSLAGKNFIHTAIVNQLRSKKVLLPAIDLATFVKRYKKDLPKFSIYVLGGAFTEFKTTSGSGVGLGAEASHDRDGGKASGDFNVESAQLALDLSLANPASGMVVDNVGLRIEVNKNRDGFTLALGTGGGGFGINLGSMEADSPHAKQRVLIEAALYALLARRFGIPESLCDGQSRQGTNAPGATTQSTLPSIFFQNRPPARSNDSTWRSPYPL